MTRDTTTRIIRVQEKRGNPSVISSEEIRRRFGREHRLPMYRFSTKKKGGEEERWKIIVLA